MTFQNGDTVLLVGDSNTYCYTVAQREIQVEEGSIDLRDLAGIEPGETIDTSTGNTFTVLKPGVPDLLEHAFTRTAQVITPKDAGNIITRTGVGKDARVIEAGTGSGFLTAMLANVVSQVYSYETHEDRIQTAEKNLEDAGFDNVIFHQRDVKEDGFEEEGVDLAVLDMKHPEDAILSASEALAPGGHLVVYCPVLEQVRDAINAVEAAGMQVLDVVENQQRSWQIFPDRPKSDTIPHTAFLVYARKLN